MSFFIGLFIGFFVGGATFAFLHAAAQPMPRPSHLRGYQPTRQVDGSNPPRGKRPADSYDGEDTSL